MKLSIVTTLYRSTATIDTFCRRALAAAALVTREIELVIVNDGSPDNDLDLALALQRDDPRIVVIDLSRNFGHHRAMMTGLAHATGDMVFLIDCDLEEEPELLAVFHERLTSGNWDVVYGVQHTRRGSAFERITGNVFFSLAKLLNDQPIPRNLVTARLMTRDYVRALVRHRDREFLISHLWLLTGFRQTPFLIAKLGTSPSTYSFTRRVDMAVKYITTTSTRLLYIAFYAGILIFALSVLTILYYLARYFTTGVGVGGYTSLIVSIWFFGGLTTFCLGILGIYIANILAETKRRPYAVIRKIYRGQEGGLPDQRPSRLSAAAAEIVESGVRN